jgi:DNA-binding NarL/FixJ family response regulator
MIAEDNVLLREGLVRLFTEGGIEVAGTSGNADKLLVLVADDPPDVAIVDIRLPPTHTDEGMKAALKIRAKHPDTGVLVLSQYVEVGLAMQLLGDSAAGAGYLLKDRVSNVMDFMDAVARVAEGGSAIYPTIVSALITKQRRSDPLDRLTPREREVLAAMAEGHSNAGIGEQLVISAGAGEKHIGNGFTKLGLDPNDSGHRRVLAVLAFLRDTGPLRPGTAG